MTEPKLIGEVIREIADAQEKVNKGQMTEEEQARIIMEWYMKNC